MQACVNSNVSINENKETKQELKTKFIEIFSLSKIYNSRNVKTLLRRIWKLVFPIHYFAIPKQTNLFLGYSQMNRVLCQGKVN